MKRLRIVCVLSALTLVLSACGGMTVNTDFDDTADFASYSSFAWMDQSNDTSRVNQLVENRIKAAVIANLTDRGYLENNDAPDIYVTYMANVQEKVDVSTTSYGYWRGSAVGNVDVYRYNEGTLIIDIIERERNQLVWRGSGTGVIGSDAGSQDKVNKAIKKILQRYPPQ